jgi:hypothetical protein
MGVNVRINIRALAALLTGLVLATPLLASPAAAEDIVPGTPTISGTAQYEQMLTAVPGAWTPEGVAFSYQWFRDGVAVTDDSPANGSHPLVSLDDIGRAFSVRVTGSRPGSTPVSVTSSPTAPVAPAVLQISKRPTITGTAKYGKKLTGHVGRFSRRVDDLDYRWLRDDRPISGATGRHYKVRSADVGTTITFRVTAKRSGFTTVAAVSRPKNVKQRAVRKTVRYSVATRGNITASLSTFKRLAQETYDDPRGWRAMGVKFKRVSSGGDFTLVLSQASKVPSFSSACSTTYSCRVGRNVIINETRWQQATPTWDDKHGTLRDYRHLVVNHETGHWFGRGHASCGGKGQLAPVMQQQSKGLGGCRINPWPKKNELHSPRFGF